ncbi:MAG TPA: DUF3592 domain-containing protein [Allosphingosinicella sp.]|jgi:hypothetical protein
MSTRGVSWIFLGIGILAQIGGIAWFLIQQSAAAEAGDWPTATGEITRSDISGPFADQSRDGRRSNMYGVDIEYEYRVDGERFTSNRVWLSGGEQYWSYRSGPGAVVDEYRVGDEVDVRYDPEDPERSALILDGPGWLNLIPFGLGILFIFFGVVIRKFLSFGPRPPQALR